MYVQVLSGTGTGVTESCEPTDTDAGNQAEVP